MEKGKTLFSRCHVLLFVILWTAACQASLSFTLSWNLLRCISIKLVILSNHLFLSTFSFCLQSFPASGSLQMNVWLFASSGQNIGAPASASVLPENVHSWFPLGWLVGFPCSPRDSQESSTPQFKSIHSLPLSFLYGPTLTSIHKYWKNHSFKCTDFCWQSDAFTF